MPFSIITTRLAIRSMLHHVHVNELKTLNLTLREEQVTDGSLITSPYDLTGLTANIIFKRLSDGELILRSLTVDSAADGQVSYTFLASDFATDLTLGKYNLCVQVVDGSDVILEEEAASCPAFEVLASCTPPA